MHVGLDRSLIRTLLPGRVSKGLFGGRAGNKHTFDCADHSKPLSKRDRTCSAEWSWTSLSRRHSYTYTPPSDRAIVLISTKHDDDAAS